MAPPRSKPEGEQKQSPTPQKAPKQQARKQAPKKKRDQPESKEEPLPIRENRRSVGLCFLVHLHDLLADEFFVFVLGTAES